MRMRICAVLFLFAAAELFSQTPPDKKYLPVIKPFVEAVENNDREKIVSLVRYPLQRRYPIPDIHNAREMAERYDQVFDEEVINKIIQSSIEADWHDTGWRGIQLDGGLIWIDYNGKLAAVNHQTAEERELRNCIIAQMKMNLHESLREFASPELFCETGNYKIRIDLLNNNDLRFALWPIGKDQSGEPDLVLFKGERTLTGSGGNHFYEFHHNDYQYILFVDVLSQGYGDFFICKGIDMLLYDINVGEIFLEEHIVRIEH